MHRFNRRRFVTSAVAFASSFELQRAARALGFSSAAEVCRLAAEQEQGPFYVDDEMLRSNITEGKPGVPLALRLLVLDSRTCKPLPNVAIDLWHCDAMGLYAGYTSSNPGEGPGSPGGSPPEGPEGPNGGPPAMKPTDKQTFLRGIQMTDAEGAVRFETVFPGFYMGRTNHVHFKVRLGGHAGEGSGHQTYLAGHVSHIGQLFFPEELATELMKHEPYSNHQIHRTTQQEDGIYTEQHGASSLANVAFLNKSKPEAGLSASLIVAVDPTATPASVRPAGPFGPPPSRRSRASSNG